MPLDPSDQAASEATAEAALLRLEIARLRKERDAYRELSEALDGMLALYKLGDMRNLTKRVDRARAARKRVAEAVGDGDASE